MFRNALAATLAFVALVTLSIVGLGTAAHALDVPRGARTLSTCTAYVDVYEDGTWDGATVLNADGTHLADTWEVTGPDARGFHVDPYGRWSYGMAFGDDAPCQIRDARELWAGSDSTALAPCVTAVDILEDGTWAGREVTSRGVHVADTWTIGGPTLQGTVTDGNAVTGFVPMWDGTFCSYGLTS